MLLFAMPHSAEFDEETGEVVLQYRNTWEPGSPSDAASFLSDKVVTVRLPGTVSDLT